MQMVENFGNKENSESISAKLDQLSGFDFDISKMTYRSKHYFDVILIYAAKCRYEWESNSKLNNALACQKWGSRYKILKDAIKVMEAVKKEL